MVLRFRLKNFPKRKTKPPLLTAGQSSRSDDLDDILTDNNPILEEIFQEEDMAQERSTLTKNRKIEKSFEDLLTGLSDENDDDIDDLVDFDNLPEMCSDATLIAITKTNKPYTNAASMDDSLRMSEFDTPTDFTSSKTNDSDVFNTDDFFTGKSNGKEEYVENDKLIDFGGSEVIKTEKRDELFEFDSHRDDVKEEDKLIDFDNQDDNDNDISDEKIDDENSMGSDEVEEDDDDGDKYEPSFVEQNNEKVDVMLTDETGNAVDIMDQDTEEVVNGLQREESIDLDAIVQDNTHLDVDIGKQKTVLRKKGSLAKRRKPSRTSVHSMGAADENSRYSDSTEPKPVMQNGHTDEDVFSRNSSSSVDSDAQSPPAKKPLPGMVALPGMGMPMGLPKRKSRGSSPSDSDLTPDEAKKDFRNIGVKLPIPSSRGSSESDNHSNITSPKLRKTSDKEAMKSPVEPTHQFEKPKLKAVSRPVREQEESDDSKMFDMPALKQVEKSPTKSRAFEQNDDMDTKHVFQTPKLRKVDDAPTESLRFIHGKTGEDDETESRISDDSRHIFQTPTLKKVDNPPTKTLRNLHGNESDMKLTLGDHMGESSTDDIDIGMYFEKPQLRNVPKPTETLRNVYKEKPQIDVPELKNVPKMELELKSPTEIDNKFNVPQLKSVQKERETDNQEKEEGTFQIPTLRSTPLPKRREPPKSPETKTFDVPMLRRTPRVKSETDTVESEKPPTGIFEKPKLKSARSLQQDMDDSTNKDSHSKHRFDVPSLRNTPSKKESSVQRSESVRSDHEKPSWLQDTKLKPTRGGSIDSSGDKDSDKPSWLTSDTRKRHDSKENKNVDSFDLSENTQRKSSIPLQETKPENGINGHHTPSRTRLTSASSEHDDDEIKTKKTTGRDQYVPSWLKTTDTKGKSPSTPNLAFVTPTKDSSEVPQWKRELAEKRRRQKDGDGAPTPMKAEPAGDKELPPWKVELGQMKMRQTPAKVSAHETKKSTEPEWKKAADEKRQRLRKAVDHVAPGKE
ncbi:triadin-like isoform X3 [Mytilus trossulus]|uniref:triadin-like isoform X3 n=1 Tax=Mytilus trossulus TaxID=6551 RepID=UPI0030049721